MLLQANSCCFFPQSAYKSAKPRKEILKITLAVKNPDQNSPWINIGN